MCRKNSLPPNLSVIICVAIVVSPLFLAQGFSLQLTATSEYTSYVHSHISPNQANYTTIEKPIFPVMLNNSQIQIGQNWTIICPLLADHNYHVYCYGTWVDTSASAKTDYDIYVFNPQGELESSHTEAAGFPEHLGTTVDDSLFTPKQSGNYSFVIKNDARESEGAQQATFMVIETLECDKWYTHHIEGKADDNSPSFHTVWTYEFVTNETQVELYLRVPATLDMYEARLYRMSGEGSPSINSYPLPWEPGLFGNISGSIGGYNFEHEGYRGVAYASCEYRGQPMSLNYTLGGSGANLYHLVLIGEEGSGEVEFMLKSRFESVTLLPLVSPSRVYPDQSTDISYVSSKTTVLENAILSYTTDNWLNSTTVIMAVSNLTCNATIPGQSAGSVVEYRIDANDLLNNNLMATGNYTVKDQPTLSISLTKDTIRLGENITVTGSLTPNDENSLVQIQFYSSNSTQTVDSLVSADGTFTVDFAPDSSGMWAVLGSSVETQNAYGSDSEQLTVTVNEPPIYVKYSLYIIIGLVVVSAVGGVVYFLKFRGR